MTTAPTATDPTTVELDEEVDGDDALVRDDLLVEDVSIDGMCGVY